jgi:hypothetical protein
VSQYRFSGPGVLFENSVPVMDVISRDGNFDNDNSGIEHLSISFKSTSHCTGFDISSPYIAALR